MCKIYTLKKQPINGVSSDFNAQKIRSLFV